MFALDTNRYKCYGKIAPNQGGRLWEIVRCEMQYNLIPALESELIEHAKNCDAVTCEDLS